MIPQPRLDPIALRPLRDFVPLPNTGPNSYTASPIGRDHRDQSGVRLDYHPNGSHSLLGRYHFDGATRLGDPFRIFRERVNEVFQFANDVTWLRGRHSLKFGVDVRRDRIKMDLVQRPNGSIIFSGAMPGNGAADFLLGQASQISISTTQAVQDGHSWVYAGYAHDQFRISPALTLDVGVRYELPLPIVDQQDATDIRYLTARRM